MTCRIGGTQDEAKYGHEINAPGCFYSADKLFPSMLRESPQYTNNSAEADFFYVSRARTRMCLLCRLRCCYMHTAMHAMWHTAMHACVSVVPASELNTASQGILLMRQPCSSI